MGGAPKHPVWYYNLTADPEAVTIQDGPEPFDVTVRELSGDERQVWWDRAEISTTAGRKESFTIRSKSM